MSLMFEPLATRSARYLALGDSYTIGEGVAAHERWPSQLAERLSATGQPTEAPTLIARTGWTTDELSSAIDQAETGAELRPPYDLVSLLIGVNNQYRGRSLAEYRAQFETLLRRACRFAGDRPGACFVLSIPDWGVTGFGHQDARGANQIGREIDQFNAVAQALCQESKIPFIDITPLSRAHPDWVVTDHLHPDARQYAEWAKAAHRALSGA